MWRRKNSDFLQSLNVSRALTWRYLIALSLLAMFSTAAWLSLRLVISEQKSTAAVVNVSGRQRMLSEQTALLATLLMVAPKPERAQIRARLQEAIQLMARSHHGLTHGDAESGLPATMSATVHARYFEGPKPLDEQVKSYLATVHALLALDDDALNTASPQLQTILQTGPTTLVKAFDQMVSQYQLEGEASVNRLQKTETALWGCTLLLLILEALLIFTPTVTYIKNIIGKLHGIAAELQLQQDQLEELVKQRTSELENRNDQVRQLAFYDPLTKLANRRLLVDRLSQAMAASKRSGIHCALMFLDLDNFKPLNDTHGHVIGDLLLIEAANRMASCVREVDTVARFGGDEFLVMLAELDADKAQSAIQTHIVAEKIRCALSEPYLLTIAQDGAADSIIEHHCTASIGVVIFVNHEATQHDLLKWADAAMYQAKYAGRNTIRVHASGL